MSFQQFPSKLYSSAFATATPANLGTVWVSRSADLAAVVMTIVINGTAVGTEQVRLRIYQNTTAGAPIAYSAWVPLTAIANPLPQYWVGTVGFAFSPNCPLSPFQTYPVYAETQGYTSTSTFYIGSVLDWPANVNTQATLTSPGAQLRFIGYRQAVPTAEDISMGGQLKLLTFIEGVTVSGPTLVGFAQVVTDTTGWTGSATTVTYTTSSLFADARNCVWTLKDAANAYEPIFAQFTATATSVTVTVGTALAAGTYLLVGVG